jgi:hypothetical protein
VVAARRMVEGRLLKVWALRADTRVQVRPLAVPTCLLALSAALLAAPPAFAELRLPPGANAAPQLPPDVLPAEAPPVAGSGAQRGSSTAPIAAAARNYVLSDAPRTWATVNICDTKASPNALGVRTSVPGAGYARRIYARFTAQWWSGARQEWRAVGGAGTSEWVYVGSSRFRDQQAGWTFRFSPPPLGTTFVMRGVVELTWRAHRKARAGRRGHHAHRSRRVTRWSVVKRRTLLTETGMPYVEGGDPPGTSKALCLIW